MPKNFGTCICWGSYADLDVKKTELSSFKTLLGDRFGDFLQNVQKLRVYFFKAKFRKIHKNRKVGKLHFILAYQISEH